jgi:tetratricopeptide (TPR) repeat protein
MNHDERARLVRKLTQDSIQFALASQWEEAVSANRELLKIVQRNPETLNRLGKALSELGRYAEAKQAYGEALELDPDNIIAKKNLDRLALLSDDAPEAPSAERIDPRLFIEEIGKTGVTQLVGTAPREVLARMNAGDQVNLVVDGHSLLVQNARGESIGQVEPITANRLIKLIQGGNRYIAAITEVSESGVRVIIREIFQHPSQLGKVSFPAHGLTTLPRADIRDTLVRDHDDELDYDEDEDDYSEEAEDDIEEDMLESGESVPRGRRRSELSDDLGDLADDVETGDSNE